MNASDDSLIARAVEGDEDALSDLLVRYRATLRGRLRGRIGERYQGAFSEDDVLQVTFVEAFLRIRQFHPNGNGAFLAWLTRIAENNLRDAIRALDRVRRPPRDRRVETVSPDDSYVALLATLCGSDTTPSGRAARAESKRILEAALNKLPPDYETVVRLFDFQELPAPEIAQRMGRSAGAIHMLKARAHDRLVDILGSSSNFFSSCA
ncbi:MAG: RNA polymerase sigma factor [Phycisphaerae bacterium]